MVDKTNAQDENLKMKQEAINNFTELYNKVKYDGTPNTLYTLLREVMLNPLKFLGPPKIVQDLMNTAQPFVISREPWKQRRLKQKQAQTCKRCGNKGHTPVNCTEKIKCFKCGGDHISLKCNKIQDTNMKENGEAKRPQKSRGRPRRGFRRRFRPFRRK
jgi:hypothetical protein